MKLDDIVLILTGLQTSLIAGLFFGFSVAVNGGLHRLRDFEYVAAMQSINDVIQNLIFLAAFIGPVFLFPLTIFLHRDESPARFWLLVGGCLFYVLGTFGLTIAGNVPLNRKLERFKLKEASDQEIKQARAAFEKPWNRLHTIRTIASIVATVLIFAACLAT